MKRLHRVALLPVSLLPVSLLLVALVLGCGVAPSEPLRPEPSCLVRRAAFDLGSGTTKLKVADVDRCENRLVRVLLAVDTKTPYGDDVSQRDGTPPRFRPETIERGLAALRMLERRAAAFEPDAYAGVATAAFRRADNAAAVLARIERELGIPVAVIDQATEARLGFVGAVRAAEVEPSTAVVWDVGGRSMQLTTLGADGRFAIYRGDFASGQMRELVIHSIQGRPSDVDDPGGDTPNPVSRDEAAAAGARAEAYARDHVPASFKTKLADPSTQVLGIGALKYYGDRPASEPDAHCSASLLEMSLDALLDKSDEQIGGAYAATQVTDRALLAGFMRGLGIERVRLVDVDLTDGLLMEIERWATPAQAPASSGRVEAAP